MKVYEFSVQEGYEWVLPVRDSDFRVFRRLDGTPRLGEWQPIRMRMVTQDEHQRRLMPSDMPWLGEHAPVLGERAVSTFDSLLKQHGEMLTLDCPDAKLVVFNTTIVLPALDMDRSSIVRFPSTGRIMKVESFVFRPERLQGIKAFKVPELLDDAVFVSEEVVHASEEARLRGVGFRLLWEGS